MPDVKERAARKGPSAAEGASREPHAGHTRQDASSAQGHRSRRLNCPHPARAAGRPRVPSPRARGIRSPARRLARPLPGCRGPRGVAADQHNDLKQEPRARGLVERVHDVSKADGHSEEKTLSSSSLEGKGKETMPSDFWDHLKEQLSSVPPDFSCALELLKEVREILLSLLLPRQNRLRSEIEEALDMDFLHQQADRGDLNVTYLSKYILNMMVLLCAPVRDEAVQRLENITDPVRLLRGIFQVLGLMKMDMVNYTIQSLQPQMQEHSIQFERAQFQERLNKQPSLLDHTTKWLMQAATDLSSPPAMCHDTLESSIPGPSPSDMDSPEPLSPSMTLLMDRARLQELELQRSQLTVLASVLLVASSFSGSVLFGSPQFVDKLKRITKSLVEDFNSRPEETMCTVSDQVTQEIHQSLKSMGLSPLSSDNTASLIGQLQNIAKKENCVRSVIDQRIHLFLKCCLVLGVQRSLMDLPGGLTLIEAELAELGQKFVSLTQHNQQVFGPYYTEILKPLLSPGQV